MVFSTIDIGTNTILMVTLQAQPDGTVRVLGDEHEIARLGKGVDAARRILPETFDRVAGYLLRYGEIATELGAERITAFGTSALRDAANREEFIAAMKERTGIEITVLSGEEEARRTFEGALFGFPVENRTHAVLDIGGGSTEIAVGTGGHLEHGISIDIGAVRITERFLQSLPASAENLAAARAFAHEALRAGPTLPHNITVVGVAGTVTTLGAMVAGIESFNADMLDGVQLSRERIAGITEELCGMELEAIRSIPQVHPERADILPGGAIILDEFMRRYDLPAITVSTRGVRYGVAVESIAKREERGERNEKSRGQNADVSEERTRDL